MEIEAKHKRPFCTDDGGWNRLPYNDQVCFNYSFPTRIAMHLRIKAPVFGEMHVIADLAIPMAISILWLLFMASITIADCFQAKFTVSPLSLRTTRGAEALLRLIQRPAKGHQGCHGGPGMLRKRVRFRDSPMFILQLCCQLSVSFNSNFRPGKHCRAHPFLHPAASGREDLLHPPDGDLQAVAEMIYV